MTTAALPSVIMMMVWAWTSRAKLDRLLEEQRVLARLRPLESAKHPPAMVTM